MAARQYGLVTREQLLHSGVTRRQLDRLVTAGWLARVHTGVYAIGRPRADAPARWLAATLSTGGVLSHRSAAELWDLLPARGGPVHVTRRSHDGSSRRRIALHHGALAPDETTRRRGIPCTSLVRTLCDLAGAVDARTLARAFEQAQVIHHLSPAILGAALVERPGRRGVSALTAMVGAAVEPGLIESVLELRFLRFCQDHDLPRPITQKRFGRWRADFCFEAERVVVETDGGPFHATAAARARDAEKAAHIESLGWRVLRVRWRELHDEPDAVAARLRSAFSPAQGEGADLSP